MPDDGPRTDEPRAAWKIALIWALVTALIRVAWLWIQPPIPEWDGAIYHRTAERIARGMGFVDTWNNLPPYKPTAFYPVGYPGTLGALYLLFGSAPWVAGALNVASSSIAAAVISRMGHRAWGRAQAHAAGALFALSPGAILYCSAYMTELLSAAVLALALLCALRHRDEDRARWAVAAGVLLGFGGLVRPPALLIAPIVAVLARARTRPAPLSALRALVLVGVSCCAVVLPWTARNCRQLDGCALVSLNGGSNLWIGADPDARGGYRDIRIGEACLRVRGEVAKDRCFGRLAMERIAAHPLAWLSLAPLKVGHLLGYESTPVSYLQSATRQRAFRTSSTFAYALMTAYHWILLALAAVGLAPLRHRRPAEITMSAAVIAGLVAVHVVFFGVDRYHFVFTPLLCLLAAGAFRDVFAARAATATPTP